MTMPTTERVVKTSCSLCFNGCGLSVHVRKGKIVKVSGLAEHPISKGQICPRAESLIDWEYAVDRLKYPMKREDGGWKRISWDEALDSIAAKLNEIKREYGARAFVFQQGWIESEDRESSALTQRLAGAYGTPNFFESGLCYYDIARARMLTFGRFVLDQPDESKCILLWGHNPDGSAPPKARRIREAINKGAQLIVINPERIALAREGMHLQIRPGTDLALALGMLNVIISEKLYDKGFAERWTIGFDELREHVKQYPPEKIAKITWLSSDKIRKVARLFGSIKPACIVQAFGALGQQRCGIQTGRALSILQAVTGNIYMPGSWTRMTMPPFPVSRIEVAEKPIGAEKFPIFCQVWNLNFGYGQGSLLPQVILTGTPYPIKGIMFLGGNQAVNERDSGRYRLAMQKLDFIVAMDVFMTETAKLAHIVIPAANFLEKTGVGYSAIVQGVVPHIMARNKVVEPPEECWSEFRFLTALAQKMGYGKLFPWKTEEEFVDYELKNMGLNLNRIREETSGGISFGSVKYGEKGFEDNGFPTPSGKIEIYSETLAQHGYDPLPTYEEPTQSPVRTPELAKEYPLILITGAKIPQYTHSQMRNIPRLRSQVPEPLADVHPNTAEKYGLRAGDMVCVEGTSGKITMGLKFNEDLAPGVVVVPHGWAEANANMLTSHRLYDPITGLPEFKALLCRLRKA